MASKYTHTDVRILNLTQGDALYYYLSSSQGRIRFSNFWAGHFFIIITCCYFQPTAVRLGCQIEPCYTTSWIHGHKTLEIAQSASDQIAVDDLDSAEVKKKFQQQLYKVWKKVYCYFKCLIIHKTSPDRFKTWGIFMSFNSPIIKSTVNMTVCKTLCECLAAYIQTYVWEPLNQLMYFMLLAISGVLWTIIYQSFIKHNGFLLGSDMCSIFTEAVYRALKKAARLRVINKGLL